MNMNSQEIRDAMQLQIDAIKVAAITSGGFTRSFNVIVEELTRLNALPRTHHEKSKGKEQRERYKKNMQNEEWRKKKNAYNRAREKAIREGTWKPKTKSHYKKKWEE
tara:strand:+ start:1833 stop:2153 length:321 start_codon:yes stop_codon:yes gene_type:complete